MEHIEKLADRIRKYAQNNINVQDQNMLNYGLKLEIQQYMHEVLQICINIKETSLGDSDLTERVVDLSDQSGMFLPHLIKICS